MIGVLVFDDFQLLDATGPIAAFEIAYRLQRKRAPIAVLALKAGAVRSSSGVELNARSFRRAQPETLIIAGGEGVRAAATCKATLAFVRSVARRGSRVASVCSGTYVLAEAGLLEGKRATTHWRQTRDFVARYPKVRLEADRIYVQDGNIWSSAGITAGIDLALAMIADEFGEEIAQATARQLVRLSPPLRRAVAVLGAARTEIAERPLQAAARLGARASRHGSDGRAPCRSGQHEPAAFFPQLHRRDRHLAVEGGGAAADRGGAHARAIGQRADRADRRKAQASATPNACAAPSCAPSATRRSRCGGPRGWGEGP